MDLYTNNGRLEVIRDKAKALWLHLDDVDLEQIGAAEFEDMADMIDEIAHHRSKVKPVQD